jgi:cytochrome c peroxidase
MRITKTIRMGTATLLAVFAVTGFSLLGDRLLAEEAEEEALPLPRSLKWVSTPESESLYHYVRDRAAAIRLGKALFWEMQVGSDGVQACASCHFHAGADNRLKNQVNPGTRRRDNGFGPTGPNDTLTAADFPFHKLADVDNADSKVLASRDDIASSQGVFLHDFVDIVPGSAVERGTLRHDPAFNVGGVNVRRAEQRHSPSVINAVLNVRNFWDGRAPETFNGVNLFGAHDKKAAVVVVTRNGVETTCVRLKNSSLASQAMAPLTNDFEMSFTGRIIPKIGKKLLGDYGTKTLALTPLAKQWVHPNDSVLGPIAASRIDPSRRGLTTTYAQMIKDAFQPWWWDSNKIVTFDKHGYITGISDRPKRMLTTDEYSVMEANFSLYFGIAVQMYQATLVSNQTPIDRWLEGDGRSLSKEAKRGFFLFQEKGNCGACHTDPEFTDAGFLSVRAAPIARKEMADGYEALYDTGFYNIGLRPTKEDLGIGGKDPFGLPLSLTVQTMKRLYVDEMLYPEFDPAYDQRAAVKGNFKVPGLRNVELTAPYFHNGGQGTLMQVVELYNRGGDFGDKNFSDLDPAIDVLNLTKQEKIDLVAFLKALTDERVRYQRAPFDHPQLFVPNGHPGDGKGVTDDGTGKATDELIEIAAVGAAGGPPLKSALPD